MNIGKLVNTATKFFTKNKTVILTSVGVSGMLAGTIMAVKNTPKAMMIIEEKKYIEEKEKLTPKEVVKATWKCYVPTAVVTTASAACIIAGCKHGMKTNAALTAAYAITENAYKEYQKKVIDTIGTEKEQEVRNAVLKDKVALNNSALSTIKISPGGMPCLDTLTGRIFDCTSDKIKSAVNNLNKQMRDEMFISLNEFYEEIGLDPCVLGENIGWDIDRGYIDVTFSSQIVDNDKPCLVIEYITLPYPER